MPLPAAGVAAQQGFNLLEKSLDAANKRAENEQNLRRDAPAETTTRMVTYLIIGVVVVIIMLVLYLLFRAPEKPSYISAWGFTNRNLKSADLKPPSGQRRYGVYM